MHIVVRNDTKEENPYGRKFLLHDLQPAFPLIIHKLQKKKKNYKIDRIIDLDLLLDLGYNIHLLYCFIRN